MCSIRSWSVVDLHPCSRQIGFCFPGALFPCRGLTLRFVSVLFSFDHQWLFLLFSIEAGVRNFIPNFLKTIGWWLVNCRGFGFVPNDSVIYFCGKYRLHFRCCIEQWLSKGKWYSMRCVGQLLYHINNFLVSVTKLLTDPRFSSIVSRGTIRKRWRGGKRERN